MKVVDGDVSLIQWEPSQPAMPHSAMQVSVGG